jgi:hypothetical protein
MTPLSKPGANLRTRARCTFCAKAGVANSRSSLHLDGDYSPTSPVSGDDQAVTFLQLADLLRSQVRELTARRGAATHMTRLLAHTAEPDSTHQTGDLRRR